MTAVFVDTGPLVALLDGNDRYHAWARDFFSSVNPPVFTCEPVLTECCYLLRRLPGWNEAVLKLVATGVVGIEFRLRPEIESIGALLKKYCGVPMSLADACLVRMAELQADSTVVTFDSDFHFYRRNRRQLVPTTMPAGI